MTERLLQFIWRFQYFNKGELAVVSGESLRVVFPGRHNTNQGPDFTDAKIRIGDTLWAGTVELHIKTSDWVKHHHQHDRNYDNVILHVVWEDDGCRNAAPVTAADRDKPGNYRVAVPVVELKDRVPGILLTRYEELMNTHAFIPCEKNIHTVRDITWKSWKERLLAERLLRKASVVETCLQRTGYHWEETFWWLLARNFGMKVNAEAFEAVARSVPFAVLGRQKQHIHQLEALLLGQAGLLEGEFKEDYPRLLKREYRFQQGKYGIRPVAIPVHFLRMRPGNFPTIRLAQLAMLVHEAVHLFSKVKEAGAVKEVRGWLNVTANDYWHYHYRFDEVSPFKKKKLGSAMIDNIIINTVAPVLFAYGNYHQEQQYKDKALLWLEKIDAEKNAMLKGFEQAGIDNKSAYDSQALIELKTQYCDQKLCLDCAAGNYLLKT